MRDPALADVTSLFVSPHPDDVPLSIGGVAALASAGERCLQVTVFSAAPAAGPFSALAAELHAVWGFAADDAAGVWETRRREDQAAAELLGLDYLAFDYTDAIYRGYDVREALRGALRPADRALGQQITDRLIELWRATHAAAVYLPLSAGCHVDHVLCAATVGGLRAAGAAVWYYEDLPYVALAPGGATERLAAIDPGASPRLVDVSDTMERRVRAIACHASQAYMLDRAGSESTEALVRRYAASLAQPPCRYAERCWRASDASNNR